ncbi:MAG: lipopolysaccharide biosynthesis protein [Kangiella sp.]|nr:lipopolysaccharide biosynthesis protein [Kangiella sp.]
MNKISKQTQAEYLSLKDSMDESQWNSVEHLFTLVNKFKDSNPSLSLRILQRIKHLNNSQERKLVDKIHTEGNDTISKNKTKINTEPELTLSKDKIIENNDLKDNKKSKLSNGRNILKAQSFNRMLVTNPFSLFVLLPWLIFFVYLTLIASPRYVSESQLIVEQPDSMATMDTGMALLSGLGVKSTGTDAELVKAFIYSADLIDYLDEKLDLKKHYSSSDADFISRLSRDSSKESFYAYFENHVEVNVDQKSQVISVKSQGFTPEFAQALNKLIVERAEWYINQIGNKLAKEQLKFIQNEHELVEERIRTTKKQLLEFQNKYGLLDPEAEGMAIQKIAYSIESLIAQRQAELKALKGIMSDTAPQVTSIVNEINALEEQLKSERSRLTNTESGQSVSEILSKFVDFKVDMELALKAYASSQISIEKSRVEAYRQIKYLVVVESPTLAEESSYPKVLYNLALLAVVLLMLFGIGKIIYSTIHEISK